MATVTTNIGYTSTSLSTMTVMSTSSPVTEGEASLPIVPGGQGARGLGQELEKLLVSPFMLAVVGAGILLTMMVCSVCALVLRIHSRRGMGRGGGTKAPPTTPSWQPGYRSPEWPTPPYLGSQGTVKRLQPTLFTHRPVDYPLQYRGTQDQYRENPLPPYRETSLLGPPPLPPSRETSLLGQPPLPPSRETSLTTFSPLNSSCLGRVNTGFTVDCTAPEVVSGPATPGPGSNPGPGPGSNPGPGPTPVTVAGLRPGHMPGSPPVPGERVDSGCQTMGVFTLRCPRPVTGPLIPQARLMQRPLWAPLPSLPKSQIQARFERDYMTLEECRDGQEDGRGRGQGDKRRSVLI